MVAPVVVAEIVRSGFVEGDDDGSWVALDADGSVRASAGTCRPILRRSRNKPLQALAMVEAGLSLEPELLALACGSHSGEPFHIEGVRRILASAGLSEEELETPPDYPLDDEAREELIRSGGKKAPVLMNCSGKHAAMLATCVANDWPLDSDLDVDHPLQQAIASTFARMTGEPVSEVAVDGCGAPLLPTSLNGLARAFSRLATPPTARPRRWPSAICSHPEYVSGTQRDELTLLRAVPGAIGKAGAEPATWSPCPTGVRSRRRPTTGLLGRDRS